MLFGCYFERNHVKLKWMTPSSIIYLIMTDSQHCVSIIYELCGQCIVLLWCEGRPTEIRVKEVSKHLSIYIRFILLSPKYTKYIIINYFTQDVYMVVCQINK